MPISVQEAKKILCELQASNNIEINKQINNAEKIIDEYIKNNLTYPKIVFDLKSLQVKLENNAIDQLIYLYQNVGWQVTYYCERCPNGKQQLIFSGHHDISK